MHDNNLTLEYYEQNAKIFAAQTQLVDFKEIQNKFLSFLNNGSYILDFGCGSGRDTKYFIENGMRVEAWDGSEELCKIASDYSGCEVKHKLFQDLSVVEEYDAIWACSSILHLPLSELKVVLKKIELALKKGGLFYTSFKYGSFSGERNGRYFTDMTEDAFDSLIARSSSLQILEQWRTGDVRYGREDEQWLNILIRKQN